MDAPTTKVRRIDAATLAHYNDLAWPLYVTFDELEQRLTGGAR